MDTLPIFKKMNHKACLIVIYSLSILGIYCCLRFHDFLGGQYRRYLIDYYFLYLSLIYILIAVFLYLLIRVGEKLLSYLFFLFYNLALLVAWTILTFLDYPSRVFMMQHYRISNIVLGMVLLMLVQSAFYQIKRRSLN